MIANESEELRTSLELGAKAAAGTIFKFLARADLPDQRLISVERVSDLYAKNLTEAQRACFRDAVVLLLEGIKEPPSFPRTQVARLARDIGIFAVARQRTEERIFEAALKMIEAGHAFDAAPLLFLLAEDGSLRTTEDWTHLWEKADGMESVVGPCIEGLLRHGSREALSWIAQNLHEDLYPELFAEFLPRMVRLDPRGVDTVLAGRFTSAAFRRQVYADLARYQLSVPKAASLPRIPSGSKGSSGGGQQSSKPKTRFEIILEPTNSIAEGAHRIATLDGLGLPDFFKEFVSDVSLAVYTEQFS